MHKEYLKETYYFDYSNSEIQTISIEIRKQGSTARDKAVLAYYKVRDGWRYNAYKINLATEAYRSSEICKRDSAHCIDKSTLLISILRALGVPARIELAKIKNHLAVEKLIDLIGTDELVPHGFVSMYLDGKWVKASPAFNRELCDHYNVAHLDFNGIDDSIFQEYNHDGHVFMEYLEYYGAYDDLPLDFIFEKWRKYYPGMGSRNPEGASVIDFF